MWKTLIQTQSYKVSLCIDVLRYEMSLG